MNRICTLLFILLFLLAANPIFANSKFNTFPIDSIDKHNQHWIDSLEHIIKKGLPSPDDNEVTTRKQIRYLKACILLGNYYQQQFALKKLLNMKKALFYYEKITGLTDGTDSDLGDDERVLTIRNKIRKEVADIYFFGDGIKKDLKTSLLLAFESYPNRRKDLEYYSKRYFNTTTTSPCLTKNFNFRNDSIFSTIINPFYLCKLDRDFKFNLDSIAIYIGNNPTKNIMISISRGIIPTSIEGQACMQRLVYQIKKYLVEIKGINENKIVTDVILEGEGYNYKKSYYLPYLTIIFTSATIVK